MHDYILLTETRPAPHQPPDERLHLFHIIIQGQLFNEWVQIWSESLGLSIHSQTRGVWAPRSRGHARSGPRWMRLNLELLQLTLDILGASGKVWWRWLPSQPRSALWVTESTRGKYWGNPSFAHRPGRTMCLQYYQMWCLCLGCLGKWGPAGVFFWKVSDKLSSCLPHTPFPNPARSSFADRSARGEETGAPRWDYLTVYTSSSIGFLSRPRHIISAALSALKKREKRLVYEKNFESCENSTSVPRGLKRSDTVATQAVRRDRHRLTDCQHTDVKFYTI